MVPSDELEPNGGSRTRRVVIVLIVIIAVTALVLLGLRPAPDRSVRESALEFELPRLSGEGRLSSAALKGAPYVLNFWATWCDPCREEMPAFDRVWRKFKDEGVTVIGVNIRDDPQKAREFAGELGVSYPLVVDVDQKLAEDLRVNGLPQTFFLDGEGKLFEQTAGSLGIMTARELEERVRAMLQAENSN